MSMTSTERARLRKRRIRDGLRLLHIWLNSDDIAILRQYALMPETEAVEHEEIAAAIELLLRALHDRGVALSVSWAMTDALVRGDRERGERLVQCLCERELLHSGRYSAFGRPPLSRMSAGADGA